MTDEEMRTEYDLRGTKVQTVSIIIIKHQSLMS